MMAGGEEGNLIFEKEGAGREVSQVTIRSRRGQFEIILKIQYVVLLVLCEL